LNVKKIFLILKNYNNHIKIKTYKSKYKNSNNKVNIKNKSTLQELNYIKLQSQIVKSNQSLVGKIDIKLDKNKRVKLLTKFKDLIRIKII